MDDRSSRQDNAPRNHWSSSSESLRSIAPCSNSSDSIQTLRSERPSQKYWNKGSRPVRPWRSQPWSTSTMWRLHRGVQAASRQEPAPETTGGRFGQRDSRRRESTGLTLRDVDNAPTLRSRRNCTHQRHRAAHDRRDQHHDGAREAPTRHALTRRRIDTLKAACCRACIAHRDARKRAGAGRPPRASAAEATKTTPSSPILHTRL